jgi:hypothetical protein
VTDDGAGMLGNATAANAQHRQTGRPRLRGVPRSRVQLLHHRKLPEHDASPSASTAAENAAKRVSRINRDTVNHQPSRIRPVKDHPGPDIQLHRGPLDRYVVIALLRLRQSINAPQEMLTSVAVRIRADRRRGTQPHCRRRPGSPLARAASLAGCRRRSRPAEGREWTREWTRGCRRSCGHDSDAILAELDRPLASQALDPVEGDLETTQTRQSLRPVPPKWRITPDRRQTMCRAAARVVRNWVRMAVVIGRRKSSTEISLSGCCTSPFPMTLNETSLDPACSSRVDERVDRPLVESIDGGNVGEAIPRADVIGKRVELRLGAIREEEPGSLACEGPRHRTANKDHPRRRSRPPPAQSMRTRVFPRLILRGDATHSKEERWQGRPISQQRNGRRCRRA